jgi:uncharacterized protein YndB with AHSA1/START domain
MANKANPEEVVLRQLMDASIETAFEAWTDPEHVKKWWSPNEATVCTLCEIDLRVGGHYRIDMHDSADQSTCKVQGQFQEISPPERLVYTWNAETHQGTVTNTLVTVEFHRRGTEKTEIVLRHSGLPDTPIRQGHRETWEKMLASYSEYAREAG